MTCRRVTVAPPKLKPIKGHSNARTADQTSNFPTPFFLTSLVPTHCRLHTLSGDTRWPPASSNSGAPLPMRNVLVPVVNYGGGLFRSIAATARGRARWGCTVWLYARCPREGAALNGGTFPCGRRHQQSRSNYAVALLTSVLLTFVTRFVGV